MNLSVKQFSFYKPQTSDEEPKLEYLSPLFRRRLSQLTRMTVEVVHDILEKEKDFNRADTKIVFASFRGELGQTYKVNEQFAEDKEIKPATFSLSVYNCPVAQATIAFSLEGGYTAVYPKEGDFYPALLAAVSPLLCGDEKEVLFVFADETVSEVYKDVPLYGKSSQKDNPFAFAALLTSKEDSDCIPLNISDWKNKTSEDFITSFAR